MLLIQRCTTVGWQYKQVEKRFQHAGISRKTQYTTTKHTLIFIVLLENGKSHKTQKFFQHDSKFKICPCCSFLHHGVTTTAGLWSTLKTISACFYCNRTIKHSCTVPRLNVFRRFQNGGGVPVEITARRPQPKRRQINLLYVKCDPPHFLPDSPSKGRYLKFCILKVVKVQKSDRKYKYIHTVYVYTMIQWFWIF
jgi:hypothetical protein